jgi:Tfp pilus assembly protein PilX
VNRRALRDFFCGERGIALPMALGIMMVISIALVTVLELSSSGQRSSNISKAEQVALAVAEAGLNHAEAVLANASDPSSSSSLPSSCGTQIPAEGGTFCYWGSLSGSTWTVNARSTVPNPSGGAALTHDVSQQLTVSLPTGTTADDPAWKYIYSDSPTGCMDVNSSVQLEQPIYVKNDLCLNSSVKILAASGELNVGGKLTTNSSVEVGTLTEPIPVVRIGGAGCKYGPYGGLGYLWPCTAVQRVWATSQSQTLPPVSKPPADLAYWYANAKPGPSQYCASGSFPGGPSAAFDGDGTLNNAPLGGLDLMPGTAYDCVVMSGTTTLGRLKWEPGSPHGTLTIAGTIFFDRDITINGSEAAVVSGRGTIYSSGKIWLNSSLHLCGKWSSSTSTCDWDTWDPDVSMLMFVSGSGASGLPSDTYGIELGSSVRFQGALYSVGDTYLSSSVIQQGPIVANQVHLNSSVGTSSVPYDNLTPGAPSATPPTPTVTLVAGSWRG